MVSGADSTAEERSPDRSDQPLRIGRYVVFAAFARGGMASVHLGRLSGDSGFARVVAVKRMHPIYADSDEHYRMLRDEARILSRIRHPNVVPLLDVVQDRGELCLVMDYVSGVSMADVMREATALGKRIPLAVSTAIMCDLLRGLHAAHEARAEDGTSLEVVHRDVSPHNVLVGTDGIARVLDFGVAKALRKEHRTMSGDLKGTLTYMAPEQFRGLPATRKSDLYSVGVVLWEALAGTRLHPLGDAALASVLELGKTTQPPSKHASEVMPALDAVVMRALAPEPRDRFDTAEEMALALEAACAPAAPEDVKALIERFCGDELERRGEFEREAERAESPAASGATAANASSLTAPSTAPQSARRGPRVAIAGLAIAGVLAIGIAMTRRWSQAPTVDSASVASTATMPAPIDSADDRATAQSNAAASTQSAALDPSATDASAAMNTSAVASPRPVARGAKHGAAPADTTCVPPFRITDAGVKLYKPECL